LHLIASFEHGPLIPAVLLFNGHLGALLTARTEAVQLPGFAHSALDWLSIAALLTALISSFRGFAEKTPRRLLAFVCISQASFILAGLATFNRQGITGALLHWFVVAVASTLLASILRIL
jgi:formate hydrogenlyase subunit 3/multisubunit Na+/H+ antiporter MnhD subunit